MTLVERLQKQQIALPDLKNRATRVPYIQWVAEQVRAMIKKEGFFFRRYECLLLDRYSQEVDGVQRPHDGYVTEAHELLRRDGFKTFQVLTVDLFRQKYEPEKPVIRFIPDHVHGMMISYADKKKCLKALDILVGHISPQTGRERDLREITLAEPYYGVLNADRELRGKENGFVTSHRTHERKSSRSNLFT